MARRWKPEEEWLLMPVGEDTKSVRRSLGYQLYEVLRDQILQFLVPPGSQMNERKIATEFGVSQTTVRNALTLLERDDLIVRSKGETAISITPNNIDMENLYCFHYILTKSAAIQAAGTISDEERTALFQLAKKADEAAGKAQECPIEAVKDELVFHQYLVDLAHNPFFSAAEQQIQSKLQFYTMQLYCSDEFRACFTSKSAGHQDLCEIYEKGRTSGNLRLFDATLQHHMFRNLIIDWGTRNNKEIVENKLLHILFQRPLENPQQRDNLSFQDEYRYLMEKNPFISIQSAVSILLLRALMDGRLHSDVGITISGLASDLCVSRNPVREAIKYLVFVGYLCQDNGGKILPPQKSLDKEKNMFACRLMLEPYAGMLASERCNKNDLQQIEKYLRATERAYKEQDVDQFIREDGLFHLAIVQATHNPYLIRLYMSIMIFSRMLTFEISKHFRWTAADLSDRIKEHQVIFANLKSHRRNRILTSCREHIIKAAKDNAFSDIMQSYLEKMDFLGGI